MKLLICGSAAAEGIPALFCTCDTCLKAGQAGGKNIRTRTAYQFGDAVRVDMGPDTVMQGYRHLSNYGKLRHLFITHSHEDHFLPSELMYRRKGFSFIPEDCILRVYGNREVYKKIRNALGNDLALYKMEFIQLQPETAVEIPELDMSFIPLLADHGPEKEPFLYLIREKDQYIFIGNDTGWLPAATWGFLEGCRLDIVILDSTLGRNDFCRSHMGVKAVVRTAAELKRIGAADAGTLFVANHFSHNGGMLHEELEDFFRPHNIYVGFDGMKIEID